MYIIDTCWECGSVHETHILSLQHKLHLCRKCFERSEEYEIAVKNYKEGKGFRL